MRKIGIYPMVGDFLHAGHMLAIKEAKKYCDYLIIAMHCCPEYKKHPIQTIFERFTEISSIKWVDEVIPYENTKDMETMLKAVDYDIYFLGEDYKDKDFSYKQDLINMNKQIIYLTRKHNLSSTNMKERIKNESQKI